MLLSQDSERLGPRLAVKVMGKLLLDRASTVILGFEFRGIHDHILFCHDSGSSAALALAFSVGRFDCCWPSPAQLFLQVSSRFMAKICILSQICECLEMGLPLRRLKRSVFLWRLHCTHTLYPIDSYDTNHSTKIHPSHQCIVVVSRKRTSCPRINLISKLLSLMNKFPILIFQICHSEQKWKIQAYILWHFISYF
jgi:hypothetical protein